MKYLINSADFTKFDYKFNKFVEKYKNDKNINKVNIYYRKFRKFCFIFKNKNTCKEIISQLHMSKQTFYYWAKRFYDVFYRNKPFEELLFKSTKPKNIKYFYNLELSEKFVNYFVQYKEEFGIGAFQFCYLIRHIDDIRFNFLPKPSVKTIYRWLKRFGFYSQKTIKKKHLRYEVKETGLLQTDICHTQFSCNICGWNSMLGVHSSKDEIKPRCQRCLWLIKNATIKNAKCLVRLQTSHFP